MKQLIKKLIPDFAKNIYRKKFPLPKKYGWFGNYDTWEEAKKKCTGYDSLIILEKVKAAVMKVKNGEAVYERDSMIFDKIEYSESVLNAFKSIAKENNNKLHVVDFGGSLGSSYFQNRNFLNEVEDLKWSIVEQKHFADCGKEFFENEELKFYNTIDEALGRGQSKVLFLSSVIQYFEEPFKLIEKIVNYNFQYIIIDRTSFIGKKEDRITIQIVPEFIYKASYPAWFFNEQKFINAFSKKYSLETKFASNFDPKERLEDKAWTYRKGFIFKLKQ